MAGLVRLRALQGLTRNVSLLTKKQNLCRTIGTSSKKNKSDLAKLKESDPDTYAIRKNWVSWGYDKTDKRIDRHYIHETIFLSVTICLIGGGYYFLFMPNMNMLDWAQREAYLELRRREELGLPPVDKDYFDNDKLLIPTDEELGDTEIII